MPNNNAQTSSAADSETAAMTHEELMKKLSSNPRFKAAKPSGEAFIIVGARRSEEPP
jgi:hypothetical protein